MYRRAPYRYYPTRRVPRSLAAAPMPSAMVTRLSYSDPGLVLNTTDGDVSSTAPIKYRTFRLNSAYDPDMTFASGHQPRGWDQFTTWYSSYEVLRCDVILTMYIDHLEADSQIGEYGYYCGYKPNRDGLQPVSDVTDAMEDPNVVVRKCTQTQNGRRGVRILKYTYTPRKFFSRRPLDDLEADVGANPGPFAYLTVFGLWDGIEDVALTPRFDIHMTYTVKFSNPKDVAES